MAVIDFSYHIDPPTNSTKWWEATPNTEANRFLIYGILVVVLAFFFGIIARDMQQKHHTGELQETWHNLKHLFHLLARLPSAIFNKENMKALAVWFTNSFRSNDNKHHISPNFTGVMVEREFNSEAIINRLASSRPLVPEVKGEGKEREVTVEVSPESSIEEKTSTEGTVDNNNNNNHSSTSFPNTNCTVVEEPQPPENALFIRQEP